MSMFLVSVITPTYNSSRFIEETIESILAQTYANWELLVTDDCSDDGTWEILTEYAQKDNRVKTFRMTENSGAGVARNNSIKHASGRYIAFCDSDDLWLPEKLEKQISFMQQHDLAFTYSTYRKITETGELKGTVIPPCCISYQDLLKSCPIGCLTAIYDTMKLGKIFMPEIRKRQDYGLWLKIFKIIKSSKGLSEEPLAHYRVRKSSVSSNKIKAALYHYKVLREIGNISHFKSMCNFTIYFFRGFAKYVK